MASTAGSKVAVPALTTSKQKGKKEDGAQMPKPFKDETQKWYLGLPFTAHCLKHGHLTTLTAREAEKPGLELDVPVSC